MAGVCTHPLIINLAPTGMVPTRGMSSHVPLQPKEIVLDVVAAARVGISMVHIHARDEDGQPTFKKDVYARIIGGIREQSPDLIICVSCSGREFPELDKRAEVLELDGDLRPDMASLTTSSLNFPRQASVNDPNMVASLAQRMVERGILPELEIFDAGMANYARYLASKLPLSGPMYANVLVGNIATAQCDFLSIASIVHSLPPNTIWGLGGLGAAQIPATALAAGLAPGVRIGLEDYLWLDHKRRQLATNVELVHRAHSLASLVDRPIMTPTELRNLLGLPKRA